MKEHLIFLLWMVLLLASEGAQDLNCKKISNCLKCSLEGYCFECKNGWTLHNHTCIEKLSNIVQSSSSSSRLLQSTNLQTISFHSFGQSSSRNCLFQKEGVCLICGDKYQMTQNSKCLPRFNQCLVFNQFLCTQCHSQFLLRDGQCVDLGCQQDNGYHCHHCLEGYLLSEYGHCYIKGCKSMREGKCLACEDSLTLNQSVCIFVIQNCLLESNGRCLQCEKGYFLSNDNLCSKLPLGCQDQLCLSCISGFVRYNQTCIELLNCVKYSTSMCLQCETNYSLSIVGLCVVTVENCLSYQQKGCTKCPSNFNLVSNKCSLNTSFIDLYCLVKNSRNQCVLCKDGYKIYPNYNYVCMSQVNTMCRSIASNGSCLSCYEGFALNSISGQCMQGAILENCASQMDGKCTKCSTRFYLLNEICKQVDQLCNTYDSSTGFCLTCYGGYHVEQGKCIEGTLEPVNGGIQNCHEFNNLDKKKCQVCYPGFYLNNEGLCKQVDPLCQTYDPLSGLCLACFSGYELQKNQCLLSSFNTNGCQQFKQTKCTKCQNGLVLTITQRCVLPALGFDSNCESFDEQGYCRSCGNGMELIQFQCF